VFKLITATTAVSYYFDASIASSITAAAVVTVARIYSRVVFE
jgi:hypothetical protein